MDTFMKSSPALSQTSEGEDRGRQREREKMKWVKKRERDGEKPYRGKNEKQQGLMTSLCEENEEALCVVLTPLNGENLDVAQRPLQAKLW